MMNPWKLVRCHVAGKHRWEQVVGDDELDSGVRCRDCDELVLERHFRERNPDTDETPPYGAYGAGAGAALPGD